MEKKWIALVILGLIMIAVGGIFFVFGNATVNVAAGFSKVFSSSKDKVNVDDNSIITTSNEKSIVGSSGSFGSGSGGGSGGGESGVHGFICNEWTQVQYSVRDFKSNVECLLYGVNGCEEVKMVCSSNIYNLDNDTGGIFGIKYSLEYDGETLKEEIVRNNLDARASAFFRSEMIVNGSYDVSHFKCLTEMIDVAKKCVN